MRAQGDAEVEVEVGSGECVSASPLGERVSAPVVTVTMAHQVPVMTPLRYPFWNCSFFLRSTAQKRLPKKDAASTIRHKMDVTSESDTRRWRSGRSGQTPVPIAS